MKRMDVSRARMFLDAALFDSEGAMKECKEHGDYAGTVLVKEMLALMRRMRLTLEALPETGQELELTKESVFMGDVKKLVALLKVLRLHVEAENVRNMWASGVRRVPVL